MWYLDEDHKNIYNRAYPDHFVPVPFPESMFTEGNYEFIRQFELGCELVIKKPKRTCELKEEFDLKYPNIVWYDEDEVWDLGPETVREAGDLEDDAPSEAGSAASPDMSARLASALLARASSSGAASSRTTATPPPP